MPYVYVACLCARRKVNRCTAQFVINMCRTLKKRTVLFFLSTKTLKLEAVKDHELSKCHIHVLKITEGKLAPEDSPAMKTLNSLETAQLERMALLFRNAHAITSVHIVNQLCCCLTVQLIIFAPNYLLSATCWLFDLSALRYKC